MQLANLQRAAELARDIERAEGAIRTYRDTRNRSISVCLEPADGGTNHGHLKFDTAELSDAVATALSNLADRFRQGTNSLREQSAAFGKDAARYGTAALSQISKETEQRPLIAIAVALGVGILIGMATRSRA